MEVFLIANQVVIRDENGVLRHYGVQGMKWDQSKIAKKTQKLEKKVNKTVDAIEGDHIFKKVITDEELTAIEAKVQREKEEVDAKIKKAEDWVRKQNNIINGNSLVKFIAPEKKRKAVDNYLKSLKVSSTTLTKLKSEMASLKRTNKQPMR